MVTVHWGRGVLWEACSASAQADLSTAQSPGMSIWHLSSAFNSLRDKEWRRGNAPWHQHKRSDSFLDIFPDAVKSGPFDLTALGDVTQSFQNLCIPQ